MELLTRLGRVHVQQSKMNMRDVCAAENRVSNAKRTRRVLCVGVEIEMTDDRGLNRHEQHCQRCADE